MPLRAYVKLNRPDKFTIGEIVGLVDLLLDMVIDMITKLIDTEIK